MMAKKKAAGEAVEVFNPFGQLLPPAALLSAAQDPNVVALLAIDEMVITGEAQYVAAAEAFKTAKAYVRSVEKWHVEERGELRAVLDRQRERELAFLAPWHALVTRISKALDAWEADQKAKAEAEATRLLSDVAAGMPILEAAALAEVVPDVPKVAGTFTRNNPCTAEVVYFADLIAAVAAGTVPQDALLPNTVWLNAQAKDGGKGWAIPGVVAVQTSTRV